MQIVLLEILCVDINTFYVMQVMWDLVFFFDEALAPLHDFYAAIDLHE